MRSQNPCFETFVISTFEVRFPSFADFILVLLYQTKGGVDLSYAQTIVPSQFNSRFQPEFGLAARRMHVNMHPSFLAGEKVEAKRAFTEDCRAHKERILPVASATSLARSNEAVEKDRKQSISTHRRYEEIAARFTVDVHSPTRG
jgi:hypothetical protein